MGNVRLIQFYKGLIIRTKKGFTLIELLVVIAIIALLLSILMPSLQKVKEQARNLICSTNEKSLFTAWSLYSSSNDGKLCNTYQYGSISFGTPWQDESSWAWLPWVEATDTVFSVTILQTPGAYVDDEARFEGIRRGSLWPYTGDVDVYHCLGEKGKYEHFRSYSIVDCMGGYFGRDAVNWNKQDDFKVHLKMNSINRPSESYVFIEENDPRPVLWDSYVLSLGFLTSSNPAWGDSITVRHRGASSFVFADGHTEFRLWSKETTEMFEDPFGVWGTVPATPGGIEDIEWMRDHWSH